MTHDNHEDTMAESKPKRKRGRPLKGNAPMSPAERQRRRRQRLIEAARLGFLVRLYAERMAGRLEMAGKQIQGRGANPRVSYRAAREGSPSLSWSGG